LNEDGLGRTSSTGIYAPLWARDRLVGVLAVERIIPETLGERERQLLEGVAEQAAMAIDNARWFGRLRQAGAEEERLRIARDLHDRVGQALAYTAFELDRISRTATEDNVREELQTLRTDTRQILGEVRETLSDLRAEVSEEQDLIETVESYLARVRRRSDIDIAFVHGGHRRLPLPVEREMWHIAREALANAERHSRAAHLDVRWVCSDSGALLEVADDGSGMPVVPPANPGGIVSMRERADAIGAALEIDSSPGQGTTVRCRIEAA
jgi:signal transduction histidine kinase